LKSKKSRVYLIVPIRQTADKKEGKKKEKKKKKKKKKKKGKGGSESEKISNGWFS